VSGKQAAKTDPELKRQMEAAAAGVSPVQAVIYLNPGSKTRSALPVEETEPAAKKLLDKVAAAVGEQPSASKVFRNLGSLVVEASPRFLEELLKQPEVASAVANKQSK